MIEHKQPFLLGINYWPRRKAMYWWSNFDRNEVIQEFGLIRDLGIKLVRIFLLWEDFQPAPDDINKVSLENLGVVLDTAESFELEVDVTFFTGHMSGPNWLPVWMLLPGQPMPGGVSQVISQGKAVNCGYRNFFSDQMVHDAQEVLLESVITNFRSHPAVFVWNLGNEPDLLAKPFNNVDGENWVNLMRTIIRKFDEAHPITCGLHAPSLTTDNGLRVDQVFRNMEFAVMHGYPMYADWSHEPLDPNFVPFLSSLTAALSGKQVLMEEFGGCTAAPGHPSANLEWKAYGKLRKQFMASESEFAKYIENTIFNLWEAGCIGAVLWCFADYDPKLYKVPPCDQSIHERHFGLIRPDGSIKPHASVITRFAAKNLTIRTEHQKLELDISAEEFYQNPAYQAKRLYEVYLT